MSDGLGFTLGLLMEDRIKRDAADADAADAAALPVTEPPTKASTLASSTARCEAIYSSSARNTPQPPPTTAEPWWSTRVEAPAELLGAADATPQRNASASASVQAFPPGFGPAQAAPSPSVWAPTASTPSSAAEQAVPQPTATAAVQAPLVINLQAQPSASAPTLTAQQAPRGAKDPHQQAQPHLVFQEPHWRAHVVLSEPWAAAQAEVAKAQSMVTGAKAALAMAKERRQWLEDVTHGPHGVQSEMQQQLSRPAKRPPQVRRSYLRFR